MSRKGSIRYQIEKELKAMCRFGESRQEAKNNNTAHKYIYSFNTLKTYIKQLNYMVDWCNSNNIKLKNISDIKENGEAWLKYNIGRELSPWTIMTQRAALCKLCQVDYSYFDVDIPKRERKTIKRGRDMSISEKHYNKKNNIEQIIFSKCTGLRLSELKRIQGTDLLINNGKYYLNINKGTKGGRSRVSEIIGSPEELQLVIGLLKNAGERKVFANVNEHINTHGFRALYCQRIYDAYARDINTLERSEIVYCRKDKKGIAYDKKALLIASEQLGHNRYTVTNGNYLY